MFTDISTANGDQRDFLLSWLHLCCLRSSGYCRKTADLDSASTSAGGRYHIFCPTFFAVRHQTATQAPAGTSSCSVKKMRQSVSVLKREWSKTAKEILFP